MPSFLRAVVTVAIAVSGFPREARPESKISHPMLLSWSTGDRNWKFALVEDPTHKFHTLEDSDAYVDALIADRSQKGLSVFEMLHVLASPALHGRRVPWAYFAGSCLTFPPPCLQNFFQRAARWNRVILQWRVYSVD